MKFENRNPDKPLPGQFLNIKFKDHLDPFLRRPFAVFDFDRKTLSILYKVVGRTTSMLSQLQKNDLIEYLGFLGEPFDRDRTFNKLWVVAGGIGIGGLHLFIKNMKQNNDLELFIGFNTEEEADAFIRFLKPLHIRINAAVMDPKGKSKYFKGNIVKLLKKETKRCDTLFACGPELMLKSLYSDIIQKKRIPAYFSMDAIMACGIGSCMGCTIKIKEKGLTRFKRVCKEGPVFNADHIVWE